MAISVLWIVPWRFQRRPLLFSVSTITVLVKGGKSSQIYLSSSNMALGEVILAIFFLFSVLVEGGALGSLKSGNLSAISGG